MKIARWIVLFTGVSLMCCDTHSMDRDVEDLEGPGEPELEVVLEEAASEPELGPESEPEPVVVVAPMTIEVRPRSDVEMAPSFYTACFSELPREHRPCRSRFNRFIPEVDLIRRFRTPGLLDITRLVLGRIILSEANWVHDDRLDHAQPAANHAELDAAAIYQVLRYTRRRGETLLGSMRRHAPHVSEARPIPRPERHRRMVWIRELQLSCRRPPHFPLTDSNGLPLNWERDYRPRCIALFALAQRLLEGDAAALGPWTSAPLITWGGRCEDTYGACDDNIAIGRGLVPYETGPTANRFWCRPGGTGCAVAEVAVLEEPELADAELEAAID